MFPNKSKSKTNINKETEINDDMNSFQQSFSTSQGAGSSSLFSSKNTMTTDGSNYSNFNQQKDVFTSIGRPLMMLKEDEEEGEKFKSTSLTTSSSFSLNSAITPTSQRKKGRKSITSEETIENSSFISAQSSEFELLEFIKWKLNQLANSILNVIIQVSQSVLNLTKASINIGDLIRLTKESIYQYRFLNLLLPNQITTTNSIGLRKIIKSMLHLLDNLLVGEVYDKSRSIILKNFYDLLNLLKLIEKPITGEMTNFSMFLIPKNFPIGSNGISKDIESPNLKIVHSIMNSILLKNDLFSDQEGSFLAPILRGFQNPNLSVLTFLFGFPELNRDHYDVIKFFSRQEEEIHFFSQKNSIIPANDKNGGGLKAPFRTIDSNYIPMSMSISSNGSMGTSGTFGGYIYPKVPKGKNKLEKYRGEIFGMTCSHVVLTEGDVNDNGEINSGNSNVSIPSPVLINMYKNALVKEMGKFKVSTSPEYQAFNRMIKKIDEIYPVKEIIVNGNKTMRNLPNEEFGNVIWGERLVNENKLSDLAIIKVNQSDKLKMINYLGDDLNISDPTIILSNLNVKSVIPITNKSFNVPNSNLPVFKVGSTTSYTNGRLNGMKLIYWSDGTLRSNEFVINGGDDFPFASGGDSGSWIVSKMSDVKTGDYDSTSTNITSSSTNGGLISTFIESFLPSLARREEQTEQQNTQNQMNQKDDEDVVGLGVLGMLHSYDGEFKQFGLFTPMDSILLRLKEITGIEWGVIGCDEFRSEEVEDYDIGSLTSD